MTTLSFVGGSTPAVSSSFTDRWVQSATGVNLPTTARIADNGNRPVYVATAQFFVAGKGANRQLRLSVGSAVTAITFGTSTSAQPTGNVTLNGIFANGGTQIVRIEASPTGSYWFGRAAGSSGSIDYYGTTYGSLAGQVEYYEVPSAPLSLTATQATTENAVNLSWSAPSANGGSPITSYTIKWSYTSDFSSSTTISTGTTATTYKITGLAYGSIVYVKVAAVNVVATAAATTSLYSSSANAYLVPPNLPLNGWANFGTLAGSTFNLVHTSITALIPETGIQRKATSNTTTGSYTIGNFGIEKTYTDLIIGRQYAIAGKAILLTAGVPGNIYRFAVNGIGNGTSVTLTSTTVGATIPTHTFTATATTHTIQIELAETISAIVGVMEHVAFYDYTLTRTAVDLIYRLQDNDRSASLVDHFDLATQSVGAYWWIDKKNVTQFTQDFNYTLPTCTFSDVLGNGNLYYNDIKTAFDTSAVINDITFDNIGRRLSAFGTESFDTYNVAWNEKDTASISNWGPRKYDLTTNLRTEVNRINILPNPNMAYNGNYTGSNFASTISSRRRLSSLVDGATGNLPVGTTQPVGNSGDFIIQAARTATAGAFGSDIRFGGQDTGSDGLPIFAVTPSTQHTFSFYGRTGVGNTASVTVRADLFWYSSSGVYLGLTNAITGQSVNATTWNRYSLTATSPATAFYARAQTQFAYVGGNNANFRYYTTCAQLETAATASAWFSGDTVDDATYVYEWEGTPGDSRSIRYLNQMDSRTGELLADFATPITRVAQLTYNTAQNPTIAATLDIGSLVVVTFKGVTATYRITGINHDITPERWMSTLQVAKVQ